MHYPIVFDLEGRDVLIVGAGAVAARKIRGLLDAGAHVRCVAPYGCAEVESLADSFAIDWERRRFRRTDIKGVFLVFATTDDFEVNRFVVETARKAAIPANCATDNDCDFFVPATTRRGSIGVAVWTGVPALTRRLRDVLADVIDQRWERAAERLQRARTELKRVVDDQADRAAVLRRLAAGAPERFASQEDAETFVTRELRRENTGDEPDSNLDS